ncbi:MAG TPA: hypothetical protein VMF52_02085 [Steroidobacteraceae bacterium]|nr:hypothetical protein [Steroidobacteraceae bacterium]
MKTVHSFSGTLTAGPAHFGVNGASSTSYFRGAQDFYRAVEILEPGSNPAAFGFDAAQCLELTLKSYLLHIGVSEKDLRNPTLLGHDLNQVWSKCVAAGLGITAAMPGWATKLNGGHQAPFLFRYAQDNTGIVLAPKSVVIAGLSEVMAKVQAATGVT